VPEITLHNGSPLRTEEIHHAEFWEKGADSGIAPVGGVQDKVPDDRLLIVMKDPNEPKKDFITGKDARADLDALTTVHFHVTMHLRASGRESLTC